MRSPRPARDCQYACDSQKLKPTLERRPPAKCSSRDCREGYAVEAMALCRKAGADPRAVYDVICTAMGASAIFESRVPRLIDGTYESGGSMRIALKDLSIVEDTTRELGLPVFMTSQATQLFRAASAAGLNDADDLAVARVFDRLAGL